MNKITKSLFFTTVLLIPLYLIKFSIFGVPTNILEILIYSTFISFLLEKPDINWRELYKEYKLYIFFISLIFIGLILSTLINQNYREGLGIIKGWFFDPILFSFVLIGKIRNQKDTESILKTFYFSSLVVSTIAFEYLFYGRLTFDGRLRAFFSSPNYLAMFLAPAIFIGLYLIKNIKPEKGIKKYALPVTLIFISMIIFFTYSYAAWISIFLSLLAVGFITKKLNKKFILILIAIASIAFLTQLNNPKLNKISSERSSLSSRMMIWKSSALMIENNFIFGIGPGNFQNKYLEYQKYFPPYLEWAVPEPHNLFLAFWLQSGLVGFIGFLFLILVWIKRVLIEIKNKKNNLILAVFLGIILYTLFHGMLDTTYWKNDLALVFWIFLILPEIIMKTSITSQEL
jgi:O-antigen ligase